MASKVQLHRISLALVLFMAFMAFVATSRTLQELSMVDMHEQWMARYGKVYKDFLEKEKRFNIFKDNVKLIENVNNAGTKPYKLAINKFADLTNEEFAARNTLKGHVSFSIARTPTFKYENVTMLPSSMDWRKKGAVTHVKDQHKCGCCWAFSAVAATEGITKLTTGKLISLSEQELVDCDRNTFNQGCNGGQMDYAFKFIQKHGLTMETDYPYKGVDGTCESKKEAKRAASIKGYENVPANNEQALQKAVASQPVSVAIDASGVDFQFYSSGVFAGSCGFEMDHAITVVGYGVSDNGMEYWLAKNSWGTDWGEEGYIRMQRNVDAKEGLCGIAMQASYPIA